MRNTLKNFAMGACAILLSGNFHLASADTSGDTEILLNWAENTYPSYFPTHQVTQNIDPWIFRHYPDTGIYAGVNKNDGNVYVMGGPWGDNPAIISPLTDLIAQINNSGGNGGIPACNTASAPAGLTYTQSGNVVNVTTNGSCIPLPTSNGFCQIPQQSSASGISILTTSNITSSAINGITITIPGIPNPFESLVNNFASGKHCTVNAPAESANLIVNSDICFDITTALGSIPDSIPGILTITPPVTFALKDTVTSQTVADCFTTDAETIYNAFTNEVWIKKDGSFEKVN